MKLSTWFPIKLVHFSLQKPDEQHNNFMHNNPLLIFTHTNLKINYNSLAVKFSTLPKLKSVIFSKQKILANNTQYMLTFLVGNIIQIHHKTHVQWLHTVQIICWSVILEDCNNNTEVDC